MECVCNYSFFLSFFLIFLPTFFLVVYNFVTLSIWQFASASQRRQLVTRAPGSSLAQQSKRERVGSLAPKAKARSIGARVPNENTWTCNRLHSHGKESKATHYITIWYYLYELVREEKKRRDTRHLRKGHSVDHVHVATDPSLSASSLVSIVALSTKEIATNLSLVRFGDECTLDTCIPKKTCVFTNEPIGQSHSWLGHHSRPWFAWPQVQKTQTSYWLNLVHPCSQQRRGQSGWQYLRQMFQPPNHSFHPVTKQSRS